MKRRSRFVAVGVLVMAFSPSFARTCERYLFPPTSLSSEVDLVIGEVVGVSLAGKIEDPWVKGGGAARDLWSLVVSVSESWSGVALGRELEIVVVVGCDEWSLTREELDHRFPTGSTVWAAIEPLSLRGRTEKNSGAFQSVDFELAGVGPLSPVERLLLSEAVDFEAFPGTSPANDGLAKFAYYVELSRLAEDRALGRRIDILRRLQSFQGWVRLRRGSKRLAVRRYKKLVQAARIPRRQGRELIRAFSAAP